MDSKVETETIEGTIDGITFRSEETGYTVFRIKIEGRDGIFKMVAQSDAMEGQVILAVGQWVDSSWGSQFKASTVTASLPATVEGVARYLASGIIKGVGASKAKAIAEKFGLDTIRVLNEEPDQLSNLPGFGVKTIEKIKKGWADNQATNKIMLFLQSNGVPTGQAWRIYKTYGIDAVKKISENPYRLADDVRGIGFKNADQIASNLGIPKDSLQRARAAVGYVMSENILKGHCGMLLHELINTTSGTLEITVGMVEAAIKSELAVSEKPLICQIDDGDGPIVYLVRLAKYEQMIAAKIKDLVTRPTPWKKPNSVEIEKIIDVAEKNAGITLAEQQRNAVRIGLTNRVMVLTGGPGTGKTSILKCLLAAYRHLKIRYVLAAPTGKAARRMKESTGSEASTLHRLFKLGQQDDTTEVGLVTDVLSVDETSMMDVPLTYAMLDGLPLNAALVIVGDIDQLPSVGPGSVLGDIIASGVVPTVRLTQIYRQAQGSLIIKNAHLVNSGQMPMKGNREGDFFFLPLSDQSIITMTGRDPEMPVMPEEYANLAASMVVDLVKTRLPAKYGFDPKKDIQVLSPMNGGVAGTHNLNQLIQKAVNPIGELFAEKMEVKYGIGDRVMQTVNNYEKLVFNGDTGVVSHIDKEEKKLVITYEGVDVEYEFNELDEIRLAYSMTIHKSQGSQFPAVVIPLLNQHYMMLARNLLYTGITRASKLVVLVGQESAVRKAVQNDKTTQRITRLKKLLLR